MAPLEEIRASGPLGKLCWDIMGPVPTSSRGAKYILVITDVFTKWVDAFAIRSTEAETLARLLVNEVICRFGVLTAQLHYDQGANVRSEVIQGACRFLGINQTQTTAYHPEGNGQVEHFNQTLEAMLSKLVKENQRSSHSPCFVCLSYSRPQIHRIYTFSSHVGTHCKAHYGSHPWAK